MRVSGSCDVPIKGWVRHWVEWVHQQGVLRASQSPVTDWV